VARDQVAVFAIEVMFFHPERSEGSALLFFESTEVNSRSLASLGMTKDPAEC
jgi:hypothetical protein